ncbi:hypothetical protein KIH86_03880 [Paenibacillus sp. HN-1]|uniref:hypothetical protein n=1 Tax=Paenibacillus TaxID=44249 RepID=UPI001CA93F7D|nr:MULTISPECIES: hypothetical protein [Paenibacillus]MBY9079547.1 hypothetical protein [Paenibacillus sp. CGMCC 1.18879]MBY9083368.1 hypothetical protein [Paenibacillus sinensis]
MNPFDVTLEDMRAMPIGSIVGIACDNCEGHEEHTKQQDGTWKCNWCDDVKNIDNWTE